MYATRSSRYDPQRNVLRNIRITAAAAARTRRNRRITWLAVIIIIGVALLIALALTDTAGASSLSSASSPSVAAACAPYRSAARITNVSQVWYLPGVYEVAGYTYGRPQFFFSARTRLALSRYQTVVVSGCPSTERQLTNVKVSLP